MLFVFIFYAMVLSRRSEVEVEVCFDTVSLIEGIEVANRVKRLSTDVLELGHTPFEAFKSVRVTSVVQE